MIDNIMRCALNVRILTMSYGSLDVQRFIAQPRQPTVKSTVLRTRETRSAPVPR